MRSAPAGARAPGFIPRGAPKMHEQLLKRPGTWVATAQGLLALGVLLPHGWALAVPAAVLCIGAMNRAPPTAPKGLAWATLSTAALVLLAVFTVRVAVPNIVSAGNSANHTLAVSTLRTILWAEDTFARQTGRAGNLVELAGQSSAGHPSAPDLAPSALLRPELAPLEGGISVYSGYAYRIYVAGPGGTGLSDPLAPGLAGSRAFLAYAWPVLPGKSGLRIYCLNEHEDILEADLSARTPPYAGFERPPAWDACLSPGARLGDRAVPGTGADGAPWRLWKGRPTRRSRGASDGAESVEMSPPRGATSAP